jgi:hypothetical protein
MIADLENPVLEHLRVIGADSAALKSDVNEIKVQQTAMGQQLAGLTTAVYGGQGRLDKIENRLDRIERRLELHDATG